MGEKWDLLGTCRHVCIFRDGEMLRANEAGEKGLLLQAVWLSKSRVKVGKFTLVRLCRSEGHYAAGSVTMQTGIQDIVCMAIFPLWIEQK